MRNTIKDRYALIVKDMVHSTCRSKPVSLSFIYQKIYTTYICCAKTQQNEEKKANSKYYNTKNDTK